MNAQDVELARGSSDVSQPCPSRWRRQWGLLGHGGLVVRVPLAHRVPSYARS
ncbi:MAG: hypothetical protein LBV06_04585 [Propionibacteriaceae bacterium]|nr:hypothetical protein [Propionibacteriaceae bacterium]